MNKLELTSYSTLDDRKPLGVTVSGRDLIVIRFDDQVSVLSGRCPHRGARLANATIEGELLICGSHGWDFRYRDGTSPASPEDDLRQFEAHVDRESDLIWIDESAFNAWSAANPVVFDPDGLLV